MNGKADGGLPRPSDFPIGSARSRGAARALAESRIKSFITVKIVHIARSGSDGLPRMQRIQSSDSVVEIRHVAGDEGWSPKGSPNTRRLDRQPSDGGIF